MKTNKYAFFILLVAVWLLPLQVTAQQDKQAKQILDKTSQLLNNAKGIQASFGGSATGELIIKGEKFFLNSNGILSWFDGKTQWSYVEENDEVNISTPSKDEVRAINPYFIINSYHHGFNYTYEGLKTVDGKKVHEITLLPKVKSDTKAIILYVSTQYIPTCIKFVQTGNSRQIDILSFNSNVVLKDSDFVFDRKKFPNADIIDLR